MPFRVESFLLSFFSLHPQRPLDPAQKMLLELGIGPDILAVTERGEETASLAILMAPGQGIVAIRTVEQALFFHVGFGGVDAHQDMQFLAGVRLLELVDLILDGPGVTEHLGGGMGLVLHLDGDRGITSAQGWLTK